MRRVQCSVISAFIFSLTAVCVCLLLALVALASVTIFRDSYHQPTNFTLHDINETRSSIIQQSNLSLPRYFVEVTTWKSNTTTNTTAKHRSEDCGRTLVSVSGVRIIHGQESLPHRWPWMASLRFVRDGKIMEHFCAGSLVHARFIVTAAHCVANLHVDQFVVVLGVHSLNDSLSAQSVFRATSVQVHTSFNRTTKHSDIALIVLRVSVPAHAAGTIASICLPSTRNDVINILHTFAMAVGWGRLASNRDERRSSRHLQQLKLKVINGHDLCKKFVPNFDAASTDTYCAHDADEQRAANVCLGDSGGALFTSNAKGQFVLYGVVSFVIAYHSDDGSGNIVCLNQAPSYFTQVALYVDWITAHIANQI